MALSSNPTPNEVVKAIKDLETNKVDKESSASKVYGTDTSGNQTTYNRTDSGIFVQDIADQYIRITSLTAGVYKLTYNGTKYIYYNGSSATDTHTVVGSSGTVMLYVSVYSLFLTKYFHWFYINGSTTYPSIRFGYTSSSSGNVSEKSLSSLLTDISSYVKDELTYSTSGTTYALSAYQGYLLNQNKQNKLPDETTAGKVLKSTSTAGTVEWGDAPIGITELSSQYVRITDLSTGIYKLTYNGTKYIYYNGSSSTSTHTVTGSSGAVILVVNRYSTTNWHWYYINGTTSYETIYFGYTTTSAGANSSKSLSNLLTGISSYVKNNLTTSTSSTTYALSAYQGYVLDQNKTKVTFRTWS